MVCLRDGKICDVRKFLLPLLGVTVRRWCTYFVSAVSRRRLIACLVCRALFNMASVLSKIYVRNTWLISRKGVRTIDSGFPRSQQSCIKFSVETSESCICISTWICFYILIAATLEKISRLNSTNWGSLFTRIIVILNNSLRERHIWYWP